MPKRKADEDAPGTPVIKRLTRSSSRIHVLNPLENPKIPKKNRKHSLTLTHQPMATRARRKSEPVKAKENIRDEGQDSRLLLKTKPVRYETPPSSSTTRVVTPTPKRKRIAYVDIVTPNKSWSPDDSHSPRSHKDVAVVSPIGRPPILRVRNVYSSVSARSRATSTITRGEISDQDEIDLLSLSRKHAVALEDEDDLLLTSIRKKSTSRIGPMKGPLHSGKSPGRRTAERGDAYAEPPSSEIERSFAHDGVAPGSSMNQSCSVPLLSDGKANPDRTSRSYVDLPRQLLPEHHAFLTSQRHSILRALQSPPMPPPDPENSPEILAHLLKGTCERGEGNSCLVLGPRSSGKTRLIEKSLLNLAIRPIVIRLSGLAQCTDLLAMREIAHQLNAQTNLCFDLPNDDGGSVEDLSDGTLAPPPAYLPTLIGLLPTLSRPSIVILDAFDHFASHSRQALLYCLLDTVQSCRAGAGRQGLAVVGVSNRIDCLNLLEKRVKSRFSHRIIRVSNPRTFTEYISVARTVLNASIEGDGPDIESWNKLWNASVERFLTDSAVIESLKETYSLLRDIRTLCRLLTLPALQLSHSQPWLHLAPLTRSIASQCPPRFYFLSTLPYASLVLLITAQHYFSASHNSFTFAMLRSTFQKKLSLSDNIQTVVTVDGGGSVKMMGVAKDILLGAFEHLVATKVFQPTAATSATTPKEYVKYHCVVHREEVKRAVEKSGNTNLKAWLAKPLEL